MLRSRQFLWLAALIAPWALVVLRLHGFWASDPQYAYAWSVPFLAAVLAILRQPTQPPREPAGSAPIFLTLSAALILPALLIQEAAPDWSVANWSLALAATVVTFLFLLRSGGPRWASWYLFPLLFLLTAIPWPQRFDLWLTQSLMQKVAAITVEILGWLDIPAFRDGNLIRLPTGAVGIDEACSGIRSLQAMLMVSLFLGDLYRLATLRRIALVAAGLAIAFIGNVIRTTFLSTIGAHSGINAIHAWHDPAGFSVLCFGLAGVWLVALLWREHTSSINPTGPAALRSPLLPTLLPIALILWLISTQATVEFWYRAHESNAPAPHLAFSWPDHEADFHPVLIPDSTRHVLLFTSGDSAAWRDPVGRDWSAWHLIWAPGRTSTQSARMHRPETCLESTGAILVRDFGHEDIPIPGGALSCREYLFQKEGAPLYVLFSLFEQHPADRDPSKMLQDWSGWSRVQRALAGQRNLGQESVEIALTPLPTDPNPITLLKARLSTLVSLPATPR